MDNFRPGDRVYTVIPPGSSEDLMALEAATTAVIRLFEAGADIAREKTRRVAIETEAAIRIEQFRQCMTLLEGQLAKGNELEAERQRAYFALADKLAERGKEELSIVVVQMIGKEGRASLVQPLIDYHQAVTLGMIK